VFILPWYISGFSARQKLSFPLFFLGLLRAVLADPSPSLCRCGVYFSWASVSSRLQFDVVHARLCSADICSLGEVLFASLVGVAHEAP